MRNEFGVRLDSNGYAPSIIQDDPTYCWKCGKRYPTERHEPFGAALRGKSKALGLWIPLCRDCHRLSADSAHKSRETSDEMKASCQSHAMVVYGWTLDEWMDRFYKNYL